MKTERLFDHNAYNTEFDATVLSCEELENGRYAVILNRTLFFPEEGGQTCDGGTLNGIEVLHVSEKNGVICHLISSPMSVGNDVHGKIDFEDRYYKMQNHTGEHIISGLVHAKYGFDNVGFHLGDGYMTMDFDGELTREQLDEIEIEANRAVWARIDVVTGYPSAEEMITLQYRSKLDLTENVRIVRIPNIDICACCAPHVRNTGEIGMIKILDLQRYKGGVRLFVLCGYWALLDYRKKYHMIYDISVLTSSKQDEVVLGVEHLFSEIEENKRSISELKRELLNCKTQNIEYTDGNACHFEPDTDMLFLRNYANAAKEKCGGVCGVFGGNDESGYKYIITSKTADVRALSRSINEKICGRGGGSSEMIQGSCNAKREEIEEAFKEL